MTTAWESELATFLTTLSEVQSESLELLGKKRQLLADVDTEGLAVVALQEEQLMQRLQECMKDRERLLEQASKEGLPSDSIRSLSQKLPDSARERLRPQLAQSTGRARLLRHHSLTNWVLVQRTLIHLSQTLEIIATGGRLQPTYSQSQEATTGGTLVDHVA